MSAWVLTRDLQERCSSAKVAANGVRDPLLRAIHVAPVDGEAGQPSSARSNQFEVSTAGRPHIAIFTCVASRASRRESPSHNALSRYAGEERFTAMVGRTPLRSPLGSRSRTIRQYQINIVFLAGHAYQLTALTYFHATHSAANCAVHYRPWLGLSFFGKLMLSSSRSSTSVGTASLAPPDRHAIVAAGIGNCLELFDLTVFGFFAATIGAQFFPSHDGLTSLLGSFATFAIGFLMRPAGALVLSSIGDRLGRRHLLSITMTLMGIASLGIAVVPNYAQIGLAAPLLLVLFRLLQGFAAGGEWGGAVTMIVEHAPPSRRGFFGSFQQVGFGLGILLGTGFALSINTLFDEETRNAWAWRLPFLFGALVAPIALYIRRNVAESPEFVAMQSAAQLSRTPVRDAFAQHRRGIAAVIGIGTAGTAAGYISSQFMSAFAVRSLHMPIGRVSAMLTLASVLQVILIPCWGWLSDRIGGLRIIGGAALLYTLSIYPLFGWLVSAPGTGTLAAVVAVSAVLVSASFGPLPALISEFFPVEVRATAVSVGYNFAAAIFGGFAPFISTWLVGATGSLMAPTFYAMACGALSFATAVVVGMHWSVRHGK